MVKKSVKVLIVVLICIIITIAAIFLIRKIFSGAGCCAVEEIDSRVQDQINKLFADEATRFVIYPLSREIKIKQRDVGGIGFAMKNTESTPGTFEYSVHASKLDEKCQSQFTLGKANNLMILGGTGRNIAMDAGEKSQAVLIKFDIPENTPKCEIEYKIDVKKDSEIYGQTGFKLKVLS